MMLSTVLGLCLFLIGRYIYGKSLQKDSQIKFS